MPKKVHFHGAMHCLPQRLKSTFFEIFWVAGLQPPKTHFLTFSKVQKHIFCHFKKWQKIYFCIRKKVKNYQKCNFWTSNNQIFWLKLKIFSRFRSWYSSSSDEDYSPRSKKTSNSKSRKSANNSSKNVQFDPDSIPRILKTFDKKPGFGDPLAELLPDEHLQSKDAVAAFLMFVLERQKTWWNKRKGRKIPTSNKVIATKWFTNMYR